MENKYLDNKNLPDSEQGKWFVYAIECDNGSVYIGQTKNILNRWNLHKKGKAAQWTRKYTPIRLFYYEERGDSSLVIARDEVPKQSQDRLGTGSVILCITIMKKLVLSCYS